MHPLLFRHRYHRCQPGPSSCHCHHPSFQAPNCRRLRRRYPRVRARSQPVPPMRRRVLWARLRRDPSSVGCHPAREAAVREAAVREAAVQEAAVRVSRARAPQAHQWRRLIRGHRSRSRQASPAARRCTSRPQNRSVGTRQVAIRSWSRVRTRVGTRKRSRGRLRARPTAYPEARPTVGLGACPRTANGPPQTLETSKRAHRSA